MILVAALIRFRLILVYLCFFSPLIAENNYTFTPPPGWDQAAPELLAPHVTVSFFTKSDKEFCPSINLATEKVSISLDQYVKSVQTAHESCPKNRWRKLGTFETLSGTATLTSIDMEVAAGKIRLLQAFILEEGIAYILTGAALQKDFSLYYQQFLQSFRSFSLGKNGQNL